MSDILAAAGMSDTGLRARAAREGWGVEARRAAIKARANAHISGDRATCSKCGKQKPATSFDSKRNRTGARNGCESRCRACKKAAERRRRGRPTRAEITARAIARRQSRAQRTVGRKALTRQLRSLLGRLFDAKCKEVGEHPGAVEFRVRYRTDPVFREKQIVRRWAKKARERGYPSDDTLTPAVLCSLFAAASHCHYCEMRMRSQDKTLDHVVPRARGGIHSVTNVVIACARCNCRKRTKSAEDFRVELGMVAGMAS